MRWLLCGVVWLSSLVAMAQEVAPAKPQAATPPAKATEAAKEAEPAKKDAAADPALATQTAIEEFTKSFVDAFNKHDAKKLGEHWSPEGVHLDSESGERVTGREAISKRYEEMFTNSGDVLLTVNVDRVRLVKPDVASVEGTSIVFPPEEEPSESTFIAVFVKQGDKWLLDSSHETNLTPPAKPYDQLQVLEFLVGEWRDESGDVDVHTICKWSRELSFLSRQYTISREGEVQHQGLQIIGWDPLQETIRSWHFEVGGGFGEGVWTQDEDKWLVKMKGVTSDGKTAAGTQVITPIDENTMTSQMVGRELDGELQPTTDPVVIVRVKNEPAAPSEPEKPTAAPVEAPKTK